jgi:predicted NBD/HSP70 family sugar kinase
LNSAYAGAVNANERLVLAALAGGVVASRARLSALTGLPKTTVSGIVGRLLRHGVLVELPAGTDGPRHPGRGRPAGGLALAGPGGQVAVLALSHGTIRAAVIGWDGTVTAQREHALDAARGQEWVVGRGLDLLTAALAEAGSASCAVVGVPTAIERGVGPGLGEMPDAVREAVPELAEVYGWLRSDPAPAVGARLGVPAVAENVANLAALGEATFGAGRGLADFVFVKLVEGVGAGLILGGRLHRGVRGLAGELAHVQVLDDGPWCACGSRGCLAASYNGFVPPLPRLSRREPLAIADIQKLVAAGEAGTRRIMADAGRRVGRVLADACVLLGPEAIVVDGMLGPAAEPFLAGMREMIDRHTPAALAGEVRLLTGQLAERAVLLGAVALARAERLT